ncbi:MAG: FAD-dependent oxidoreductase [Chloroflexi bacterium]|jgi:ribulose 1,5-bisphosphate synthetase/thiazole synthase|nr:FAD-dependent oxidoreductase [Chloroflexota bacterium]MBT3863745.1 FAD-dependent oxidoreductase [Chloroflexota bacterium]MBT4142766.1 FAD-dependent oxidoreductase [Chloroflexota bacterium]MBT4944027.1 FAD-dependent oxidoreductase [Chloroflexota bacterium]MBT5253298.1 FAD-dependent oxidoreductase [Chloroflexota bacterium]
MSNIQYTKSMPVVSEPDVLVCGTGLAGIGAAVGAARNGASVMAVDRMGFAGGFFTNIIGSAFDGFVYEETGRPVVGGLVFEMLERMGVAEPGQAPDLIYNVNGDFTEVEKHPDRVIPRTDPELFKKASDDVLIESGVTPLFHTQVSDVIMDGDRIDTVVVSNKDGLVAIRPKNIIDSTGDADVAAWAGAPYEVAESLQPMSLHFRIGFVELTFELRRKCAAVLEKARAEGKIGLYGGPWPATFSGRDIYFNVIRTPGDATKPNDWTNAEIQGRKDAWTMFELWKEALTEFKDAYFFTSGPTAGSRESRRIVGDYTLTGDDIRTAKRQDDVVVLGAWRIDRHPENTAGYHEQPVVPPYDISYRTLLPQGVDNLWVAGRCHSATSEALASSRVTANSMGMGQAAGVAAAMASSNGGNNRNVSIQELQDRLVAADVILDPTSAMQGL